MKRIRVIPTLLLKSRELVKTVAFKKPNYIGDPINAVRIFNDKNVDEIIIIQIDSNRHKEGPDIAYLRDIASEAFMPLAFGGGINDERRAEKAFGSGAEKVILNTAAYTNPSLITELANRYGSQSIVVSLDVRSNWLSRSMLCYNSGKRKIKCLATEMAKRFVDLGAGEIILHDTSREGAYIGMNIPLIQDISSAVSVPVVALGGASSVDDLADAVYEGGASAVAAGSIFIYSGPHKAVLIQYPSQETLEQKIFVRE